MLSQIEKFNKLSVNFPLTLAPMVGLSHVATRMLLREYLPEGASTLWPTEMLSSKRLPKEDFSIVPETFRDPGETGLVPQILGNEELSIQQSIQKLVRWGAAGIDINMGCPVQKALRHNYGVALMGDVNYAAEVTRMAVRSTDLPVSVKVRAVDAKEAQPLGEFATALVEAGARWITLHPRVGSQKRRGQADWTQIAWLKNHLAVPVIGNGDIQCSEDIRQMLEETGCDVVMIGRALTARPWLLWQYGEEMGLPAPSGRAGESAPRTPEEEAREYGRALMRLLDLMIHYFGSCRGGEDLVLRKFRFFVKTGHVWLDFGHELMSLTMKAKTSVQMREFLQKFFQQNLTMFVRTELKQ